MRYSVARIKEDLGFGTLVEGSAWIAAKNIQAAVHKYARERGLPKGTKCSVRTERAIQQAQQRRSIAVMGWEVKV